MATCISWLDRACAFLVGDVESNRIIQQPGSFRAVCRLLIMVVAGVLCLCLVIWLSLQQPPLRTHRHWDVQKVQFMNESGQKLFNRSMECPCLSGGRRFDQAKELPLYFFTVEQNKNKSYSRNHELPRSGPLIESVDQRVPFVTDLCCSALFHSSCDNLNLTNTFCESLLQNISSYLADGGPGGTGGLNLLNPLLYMNQACNGMREIIIRLQSSHKNNTSDLRVRNLVQVLWQDTVGLCATWESWPPPADSDFWQLTNSIMDGQVRYQELSDVEHDPTLSLNKNAALALEVDWALYFEHCGPTYCDEFIENSAMWNIFTAVSQLGGFLSLALILLRTLLWPAIRIIFGWRADLARSVTIRKELQAVPLQAFPLRERTRTNSNSW